jgi:hypothetical protein
VKSIFLPILVLILLLSCQASKKIIYSFDSPDVTDSIVSVLKKQEGIHKSPYQNVTWVALLRETTGSFELIITEKFGGNGSPLNRLLKKGNRIILVGNLRIPLFFESDILN